MSPHSRRASVDQASRRPTPLTTSDFSRAERLFLKETLAPNSFKQFKLAVLAQLCESKALVLNSSARRKDDYIAAIRAAHSQRSVPVNTTAPEIGAALVSGGGFPDTSTPPFRNTGPSSTLGAYGPSESELEAVIQSTAITPGPGVVDVAQDSPDQAQRLSETDQDAEMGDGREASDQV